MDEKTLNEIIPVPDIDDLEKDIENQLIDEGFKITNFQNGGIFKTIIMIFLQIRIELIKLIRWIIPTMYLNSSTGKWLDFKAADYTKARKVATKAKGNITLKRNKLNGTLIIPKGYIFKTNLDLNKKEYRFISLENTYMQDYEKEIKVLVEAEKPGKEYNISPGSIVKSLQHIEGIDELINEEGWLLQEGTDEEDDEAFRERCINSWDELAALPTGPKYKSVARNVTGVVNVIVDDMHPRGQGTIDIIITGTAGNPTQALIDEVKKAVDLIKGPYDDILIYGPQIVKQDIDVSIYIPKFVAEASIKAKTNETIKELFKFKNTNINKLYKAKLSHDLMNIENVENIKINTPADDIILDNKKLLQLGNLNISIVRV
jgi:uncharacterized phage protein gp47/JayE